MRGRDLTGDDVGALAADPHPLRPRARQNVIFELGVAVGRLGRERVCPLYEEGVELPSDIHSVEYTPIDPGERVARKGRARALRSGVPVRRGEGHQLTPDTRTSSTFRRPARRARRNDQPGS